MANHSAAVDALFRALADPTRRAVIEALASGPSSVSDLAAPFDMALPSFLQHLKLLEESGLVQSTKKGRVRTVELQPTSLEVAEDWLSAQRKLWETRFDQLDALLAQLKNEEVDDGER